MIYRLTCSFFGYEYYPSRFFRASSDLEAIKKAEEILNERPENAVYLFPDRLEERYGFCLLRKREVRVWGGLTTWSEIRDDELQRSA